MKAQGYDVDESTVLQDNISAVRMEKNGRNP